MVKTIRYKGKNYNGLSHIFNSNKSDPSVQLETFISRYKRGWTIDDALSTSTDHNGGSIVFKGVEYKNIKELYERNLHSKSPSFRVFDKKLKEGFAINEALGIDNNTEEEVDDTNHKIEWNGKTYENATELYNNIYNQKGEYMNNTKKRNIEYKGKFYKNARELYRKNPHEAHFSVTEQAFVGRVENLKWDKQRAFETPKSNKGAKSKKPIKNTKELLSLKLKSKAINTETTFEQAFKKSLEEGKEAVNKEDNIATTEKEPYVEAKEDRPRKPRSNIFALNKKVNPAEKRVTLYVAKAEIEGTKRAVVGFTTEDKPSDLASLDADILLLSKVGFATAGQIQNKIIEVFFNQHNLEESEAMSSSQVFDLREGEYFNALDYIYSLISSYQNSQQQA